MNDIKYTGKFPLFPTEKDGDHPIAIRVPDPNEVMLHYRDGVHFITGPIADKLYAYEHLGYSPEKLKAIIERYQKDIAMRLAVNSVYGAFGLTRKELDSAYPNQYIDNDIQCTRVAYEKILEYREREKQRRHMEIKKVIFNNPATIVFWSDGTKTVVKATNEAYDPEKGLAMAISKRALGDKGNYYEVFKKHLKEDKK